MSGIVRTEHARGIQHVLFKTHWVLHNGVPYYRCVYMDGNYKECLYMKRGIFCFPLFSIAESCIYTSDRMIFAAQATVAFLHEDLGAE